VLFLLAAADGCDLVVSARLGAHCLRDFFFDRNRNDINCWVSLNTGNRQSNGHEEWYSRRVGNRHGSAGRHAASDGTSIELSACHRPPLDSRGPQIENTSPNQFPRLAFWVPIGFLQRLRPPQHHPSKYCRGHKNANNKRYDRLRIIGVNAMIEFSTALMSTAHSKCAFQIFFCVMRMG
jgi:hypothetical protein